MDMKFFGSSSGIGYTPSEKRRRIALIIVILVAVLVSAGFIFYKGGGKDIIVSKEEKKKQEEIVSGFKSSLSQKKSIFGFVRGVQTTPDKAAVFLEVEVDLIDIEKIKNEDLMGGSKNIETNRKTFSVTVDQNTKLNVADKTEIMAGDYVEIVSPMNVYEVDSFGALEVNVQKEMRPGANQQEKKTEGQIETINTEM